jgi:hypothetical protein
MHLIGSRATLIANVCALVIAAVVAVEGQYIVNERFGIFRPFDVWGPFVPTVVMFVIRRRIFSYCFLFFYCVVLVLMSLQVRHFYLGLYRATRFETDPLAPVAILFAISLYSLAFYAAGVLIWFVFKQLESRR